MKEKIQVGDYSLDADVEIVNGSQTNVIIAHGGNNDMNAYLMKRIFDSLKGKVSVMRFNFSFVGGKFEREEERSKEELRTCIRRMGSKDITIIGKSWGGQMATRIIQEKNLGIKKIIALGYSIHPKDEPNKPRPQDHLKNTHYPIEFIIGDSDPGCNLEVFRKMLPEYNLHVIGDASHSFLDPETDKPNGSEDKAIECALQLI